MIIKRKDKNQELLKQLTDLLLLNISPNKKFDIEREMNYLKSGDRGEENSAYFIDFYFGSSKNWAVIHDLRLEHENLVAQIDHLLINRFFDFYVLETKNFSYGVKINKDGEFSVLQGKEEYPIESPIEQNKRHIFLLDKIIKTHDIMPKRLGIHLIPSFKSYILVSPKSRIVRPPKTSFDTSMVIKADSLRTEIDKVVDKRSNLSMLSSMTKMSSFDTVVDIARKLSRLHKSAVIDYKKKFGIGENVVAKTNHTGHLEATTAKKPDKKYYCSKCNKILTVKNISYCQQHKQSIGGKFYCYNCQRLVKKG